MSLKNGSDFTSDAGVLGIGIESAALTTIARRSRGTPRIAIRLLKQFA